MAQPTLANQKTIIANQKRLLSNQRNLEQILSNQAKVLREGALPRGVIEGILGEASG